MTVAASHDQGGWFKMKKHGKLSNCLIVSALFLFVLTAFAESSAWARAGGGGLSGSRGSRSFSSPRMPSSPSQASPGLGSPGRNPLAGTPGQPSRGLFGGSPFVQGLAGGLAGGLLGGLLFGGTGHAAHGGAMGGGGLGFLDIALVAGLLYLVYRYFRKRRLQVAPSVNFNTSSHREAAGYEGFGYPHATPQPDDHYPHGEVDRGFHALRQSEPGFDEGVLMEDFQDNFFRIQAAWTNRDFAGVEALATAEMEEFFKARIDAMKADGKINRLENIAVRKVEPTEVWREMGKDYITVLFTASLLDYTVDDVTGQIVAGDRATPVKFEEFWTFCRDIGASRWQLSGINQAEEAQVR
jgi:predicted lipid-binding transport protein (Tim44 family)